MQFTSYLYFLLLLLISFECILSDKTKSKIYYDIQADKFCFRRLNATHQVGCSSHRGGAIGVIHIVEKEDDIEWITKKGPHSPYIATLTIPFFTTKHMQVLKASNRVSGFIILQKNNTIPPRFSPDSSCPNENFGMYNDKNEEYSHCKKGTWNLNNPALDMMYQDWNMPIFLVSNDKDIQEIEDCFTNYSNPIKNIARPWPLCSAQLESQMTAAKDTPTCMRRNKFNNLNSFKFCDPLSDQNIIVPLLPLNKSETYENRSILVIATRIDTFSMFDKLSPGAHSVIPSLITLISIAKTLANFKDDLQNSEKFKNLVFMIFNGESFDYIGSSRVVYDMENGRFPRILDPSIENQPSSIRLEHISHFIELSQMVPNETVWIHKDPITSEQNQNEIDKMIEYLISGSSIFNLAETPRPLPPASVQQFLKKDSDIASIVLADHQENFINKYYNSLYDNKDTLDTRGLSKKLEKVSRSISGMVYNLIMDGKDMPEVESNEAIIEELLECYVSNSSCSIFQQIAGNPSGTSPPTYPLYVSVSMPSHKPNAITVFTHHIIGNFTGEAMANRTKTDCLSKDASDQIYSYFWISEVGNETGAGNKTGACIRSTAILTEAISPAFLISDLTSREYSTWTESVWSENSARIFLRPSLTHDLVILVLGFLVLSLSFGVVYVVEKRSTSLFVCRQLTSC